MNHRIFIIGFSILFTPLSLAMQKLDNGKSKLEIIDDYIAYMSSEILYLEEAEQDLKQAIKNDGPDKIDLRTISGDDWVVFLNQTIVLSSEVPVFIPERKWLKYNCEIYVEERSDKSAKIIIVPDTLPGLGDCELPDATWKAVVWLEAREDRNKQQLLTEIALPKIHKSKAEFSLCKANLEIERLALMRN